MRIRDTESLEKRLILQLEIVLTDLLEFSNSVMIHHQVKNIYTTKKV